jgi:hypothetical protein
MRAGDAPVPVNSPAEQLTVIAAVLDDPVTLNYAELHYQSKLSKEKR